MGSLKILAIDSLKPHEQVEEYGVKYLKDWLLREGVQIEPIIVEDKHNIILDGHHRVEALKNLGFTKVLSYLVDYEEVKLDSWKPNTQIEKNQVVEAALNGNKLPPKTTKHILTGRPKNVRLDLNKLK